MELKKTTELTAGDYAQLVLPNREGFNLSPTKGAVSHIMATDMWGDESETLHTVFFTDHTVHTVNNSYSWLVR